jgi:heat shock transcription factor, other eukaryote
MASQGISRKRPAPGTSPVPYQNAYPHPQGLGSYGGLDPQLSNDQFLQYGYQPPKESAASYNQDSIPQQSNYGAETAVISNQLARRPANPVVPRERSYGDSTDVQWTEPASATGHHPQSAWGDDTNDLEQKAQAAKREAQAKRKQIPPFVQKLAR